MRKTRVKSHARKQGSRTVIVRSHFRMPTATPGAGAYYEELRKRGLQVNADTEADHWGDSLLRTHSAESKYHLANIGRDCNLNPERVSLLRKYS